MIFLGLDVGTTGSKSTLWDEKGELLSSSYGEYPLYHRKPHLSELNPKEVWLAIKRVIRDSCSKISYPPRTLSISALGEAFIPVDKLGNPLRWSMTTVDARATEQVKWWEENFGAEEIYKITGQPLTSEMPIYTLQKIQWIKKYEPEIYRKTWKFLCWEDFVIFKLTGKAVIDYSLASRTMFFDLRKNKWSDSILDSAGIDPDSLADVKPPGYPVGEITKEASKETGLPEGTLIVTGGHDQPCASLGAGITGEGPLLDSTGTVECYGIVQERLSLKDELRRKGYAVHTYVDGKYFTFGFSPTGGALLKWFKDNFGNTYDKIIEDASTSPPCSRGLFIFPYFEGSGTPHWRRGARGLFFGLTLSTRKSDLARAILESLSYELRWNIDTFESHGFKIDEIFAVGGGALSEFWLRLKASITGKKIITPERKMETSALGAAILGAYGSGFYPSIEKAKNMMVRIEKSYEPELREEYEDGYRKYVDLYFKFYL